MEVSREDELRAKFNGEAYRFGENKRRNEKVGSWDSLKALDQSTRSVDAILDEYNQLRFGQEVVLDVPVGSNVELGSE